MQGSIPVSYTHLEQFEKLKVALSEAGVPNIPDYEDVIRPFNAVSYTHLLQKLRYQYESLETWRGILILEES